jgi:hypothetical protein
MRESRVKAMRRSCLSVLTVASIALAGTRAMALSLVEKNVVDLLRESDAIVVGTIGNVADGIDDRGIPYTAVTLNVSESIRGTLPDTYTFRQFGLMKPRPSPDGTRLMMPAPEGFPRYASGEQVLLFLYPQAKRTGLRTTAGLIQGKFTLGPGFAANGTGNAGLFGNVRLDPDLVVDGDRRLLASTSGVLNPDAFLSFLRRAVQGHWVETSRLVSPRPPRVVRAPGRSGR